MNIAYHNPPTLPFPVHTSSHLSTTPSLFVDNSLSLRLHPSLHHSVVCASMNLSFKLLKTKQTFHIIVLGAGLK